MRRVMVLVMLGVLALTACTPDASAPPSPSPTPVEKPTPTPDAQAQALIDAEKAYRTNIEEQSRLGMAGGATSMTAAITNTATGAYLDAIESDLANVKRQGWHLSAPTTVVGVSGAWHEDQTVHLIACEDRSKSRLLDAQGHDKTPKVTGSRLYRQSIVVVRNAGRWKLSDGSTEKVDTFANHDCGVT